MAFHADTPIRRPADTVSPIPLSIIACITIHKPEIRGPHSSPDETASITIHSTGNP